jgi:hypothetical protein
MYCKSCGAENPSNTNYCVNDGTFLKSIPVKYREKERSSIYCSNCGSKTSTTFNYCENCGESLTQYGREKTFTPKLVSSGGGAATPASAPFKISGFTFDYVKKAILPALLAIVIIFVISFAMMQSSQKSYTNMLDYELQSNGLNSVPPQVYDILKGGKLVGISDILMLLNLQNPDISFKASGGTGLESGSITAHVLVQNGFFIYLLIPFIGLLAAGILAGRKNQRTNLPERLYDAIAIGFLYSIFFTIVSFFAGFSYHGNLNIDVANISLDIHTTYSWIKTFFMTLLFGFLFSGLGILFSINFKKVTGHLEEWLPSGRAIHQAIVIPFIGSFLFFIGFLIYLVSKFSQFKDQVLGGVSGTPLADAVNKSTGMIVTLSVQMASYVWNLLHFAPMTFSLQEKTVTGTVSYSIFSGLTATGAGLDSLSGMQSALSTTDIEMYLKFALIIPAALFIWAGFRLAKQPGLLKNLLVFSVVYAIIMSGIAAFSVIGFNANANAVGDTENMYISLGFGPMVTFISSLIFSFVFAYLGSWIPKLKASN